MESMAEISNLDDYEDLEFICTEGEFELHKIRHKVTKSIFLAMIFISYYDNISMNQIINLYRELIILPKLDHPLILKFICYSPVDFSKDARPVIISEYCAHETLNRIFQADNTKKLIVIYGIAAAMSYLHSHDVIHRDLKPGNIYIDDRLFPKITNFHLAKQIDPNSPEKSHYLKGTIAYLAPEIFSNREFTKKSDVFAFSLIVYQILTKSDKLYKGYKRSPSYLRQFVANGGRPIFSEEIPDCFQKLIKKCWSNDPQERPNFDEIVDMLKNDHIFITEGVNEGEFREFIKYIDNYKIGFDTNRYVHFIDYDEIDTFCNFHNFGVQSIYDTEFDSIEIYLAYVNLKYFVKGKLIGKGKYSNFYQIFFYDRKSCTYIPYAIKIFLTSRETVYELFEKEVINHCHLYHPCISTFIGYSMLNFEKKEIPSIIFNFYSNSSLDKHFFLERNSKNLPNWNKTAKFIIIFGIAAGMSYLHSMNIIHRDLNPTNIFLDFLLFPKIGGFATSKEISEDDTETSSSYVINKNPVYASPETLKSNKNTKKSDVYSFGMILFEIVTNRIPFENLNHYQIVKSVIENEKRPEIDEKIPNCYKDLIEKCWSQNPDERPTFSEIVNILKNDKEFITTEIDIEKVKKYIQFVEGENVSFECVDKEDFYNSRFEVEETSKNSLSINIDPIDLSVFEVDKKSQLGEGSFGKVFKIIEKKTNKFFAAKILNHPLETCSKSEIINIDREINFNSQLNFPSIIKFIGYSPHNFENEPKPTIIIEFATKGTLHQIISMERNKIFNPDWNETKKLIVIYGIAAGMAYSHSKDIIHRDLKPSNIFLDDFLHPKIGDFGLSKKINDSKDNKLIGTFSYLAPEVMTNHSYSKASDVYSFALIVFQILTKKRPFNNFTRYQMMMNIPGGFRPEFDCDVPQCYKNLVKKCWSNDPLKRLTFDEIVNLLKTDENFITDKVVKAEFFNYVNEIDNFIMKNK